jgi:hypothetical protein
MAKAKQYWEAGAIGGFVASRGHVVLYEDA